jgi:Biotin-requiring enzyme
MMMQAHPEAFGPCVTFQARRRIEMQTVNINADQALWATNMLPEGIVERWFVAEGATAQAGHSVAEVRIEGALHDIVSPVSGRLTILTPANNVIEPGSLLATVAVETALTSND